MCILSLFYIHMMHYIDVAALYYCFTITVLSWTIICYRTTSALSALWGCFWDLYGFSVVVLVVLDLLDPPDSGDLSPGHKLFTRSQLRWATWWINGIHLVQKYLLQDTAGHILHDTFCRAHTAGHILQTDNPV